MCAPEWTRRGFLGAAAVAGVAGAAAFATPAAAAALPPPSTAKDRVVLKNVRVFTGVGLSAPQVVVIDNGLIGGNPLGARVIDAKGAALLPGFIDSHLHPVDVNTLRVLTGYGVTSALDMASFPKAKVDALRNQRGLTDIRSAGAPAVPPDSPFTRAPGFPPNAIVTGPEQAEAFVRARLAEGSDYIKAIGDVPGLSQAAKSAIVAATRRAGKLSNIHATTFAAVAEALTAGSDVIHHIALDRALTATEVGQYKLGGRVSTPTLTILEGFANLGNPAFSYAAARDSVGALNRAGVTVLAGTDSNQTPGLPVQPPFGTSLHRELELLVGAGLSPVQALRAATSSPARVYGLWDRGAVLPGYRADLVLVDGDPTVDIRNTRKILRVWAGGYEYPATAS